MSMSGDELRLKLHIDTSAVADDLAQVDREVQRLEQRMLAAFNRGGLVRKGRAQRAGSIEDVGAQRNAWTPEVRALDRQLSARMQQIERAAQRGETRPPLTPTQLARQEAQQRLGAASRPIEITAKQKFFDDMRQSLLRGLGSAPAMAAAQTGIPGAARAARTLMGLVEADPLLAAGIGGAALVGGGALAIQAQRAGFQRQQAALGASLVGGPAFGESRTMLGLGVMAAAQEMGTGQGEGAGIAQQLASAGMRPGQITGNLQNVLGMTKAYGLQTSDVEPLVAALGTAGGMSSSEIGRTLADLVDSSGKATGSLQMLAVGLRALSSVNAAAGRDAFGLAAVQQAIGPTSGINAGRLMAPAMGAFGSQAVAASAFLGVSLDQYTRLQRSKGGAAQLFTLAERSLQQFGADTMGRELGMQTLQQLGIWDLSGLTTDQQLHLATLPPGPAMAYYRQMMAKKQAPGAAKTTPARTRALIDAQTSWQDRVGIGLGNAWTRQVNKPGGLQELAYKGFEALTGNVGAAFGAAPWSKPLNPLAGALPLSSELARSRAAILAGGPSPARDALLAAGGGGAGAQGGDVTHTVKIDVTVRDQRGNTVGHKVDTTRVIAGAPTVNRPPYDQPRAGQSPLERPQVPGRWNEGWR